VVYTATYGQMLCKYSYFLLQTLERTNKLEHFRSKDNNYAYNIKRLRFVMGKPTMTLLQVPH